MIDTPTIPSTLWTTRGRVVDIMPLAVEESGRAVESTPWTSLGLSVEIGRTTGDADRMTTVSWGQLGMNAQLTHTSSQARNLR